MKPGLLLPSGPRTLKAEAERSCGAHTYFRTAEFLLPPSDPKRSIATQKNLSAFYNGLAALGVKYERMEAPYGSGYLVDLVERSLPATADTGRAARAVDLATRLIGQKIWTAETISPSETVPLRHFRGANLDSIDQRAHMEMGQPALRAASQRVNYAVFLRLPSRVLS